VAEALPLVVKQDGRREPFDRDKIMIGLRKACEKRPVSMDILEKAVERIEGWAQERGGKEIPASAVGERVMEELQGLDEVAYVRFASVYRQFKDINQFMKELKVLLERRERKDVHGDRWGGRNGDGGAAQGRFAEPEHRHPACVDRYGGE